MVFLVPHWMEDPFEWSISRRRSSGGAPAPSEQASVAEPTSYPELRRAIATKQQEVNDLMKKLAKVTGSQADTPNSPHTPSYYLKPVSRFSTTGASENIVKPTTVDMAPEVPSPKLI